MLSPPSILRPDTLEGIDDLIRVGLIAFRESCFNWLLVATGFVVVGLVLEGPELWHEIISIVRHWRFRRRFKFSLPEERAPNWVKLIAFVGWIFIVIGVAGEYVADSFVSRADGFVQTFDEIVLTETQNRTALASERAIAAYERASENEKETAATLKQAEQERSDGAKSLQAAEIARKEAKGFSLQIAQANERAANAEKQAAAANLELARLTHPREFGPEQCRKLRTALLPFGQPTFDIGVATTPEAVDLAGNMEKCLQVLSWKEVPGSDQIGFSRANMPTWAIIVMNGINIEIDASNFKDLSATTDAFVGALRAVGLEAKGLSVTSGPKGVKPNMIHIRIGSKQ
jgi:hypothetical protein